MNIMEDYLEIDEWNDQYSFSSFSGENIETQILNKLTTDDYFIKKQTLSEALIYLQNPKNTESVRSILDAFKGMGGDYESSLRSDLSESVITIYRLCENIDGLNDDEWDLIKQFLIPLLIQFLHDANKQVRINSHNALLQFVREGVLKESYFEFYFVDPLKELMDPCNPDELRSECFSLMVQLSSNMNNYFERDLIDYSTDFIKTNDNLRKTCASYLCTIINHSSGKYMSEWMDIFYKLSEDTSWYVRKFCIEAATILSKHLTAEEKWHKMADTYYGFMTDSKKWVFNSALQHFGEFIVTFANPSKTGCSLDSNGFVQNKGCCRIKPVNEDVATDSIDTNSNKDNSPENNCNKIDNYSTFTFWRTPIHTETLNKDMNSLTLKDKESNMWTDNSDDEVNNNLRNHTPDQDIVPQNLIECYIEIMEDKQGDTDVLKPCAFSMPAVLYTLGPTCWSYMKKSYFTLLQSMSWKVRLSLAASMHHVFEIFRYNPHAVSDLISVYKEFMKDVDEIKIGLIEHIAHFFLALPVSRYPEVFDVDVCSDLVQIDISNNSGNSSSSSGSSSSCSSNSGGVGAMNIVSTGSSIMNSSCMTSIYITNNGGSGNTGGGSSNSPGKNWRYRVSCMQQLGLVISGVRLTCLSDREVLVPILGERWLPLVFQLVTNNVHAVRVAAVTVLLQILQRISEWYSDPEFNPLKSELLKIQTTIIDKLLAMSDSTLWYLRQLYLHASTNIILDTNTKLEGDVVQLQLLPKYLYLCAKDTVPNNRMVGGHGLVAMLEKNIPLSNSTYADVIKACANLSIDSDRDVRASVVKVTGHSSAGLSPVPGVDTKNDDQKEISDVESGAAESDNPSLSVYTVEEEQLELTE